MDDLNDLIRGVRQAYAVVDADADADADAEARAENDGDVDREKRHSRNRDRDRERERERERGRHRSRTEAVSESNEATFDSNANFIPLGTEGDEDEVDNDNNNNKFDDDDEEEAGRRRHHRRRHSRIHSHNEREKEKVREREKGREKDRDRAREKERERERGRGRRQDKEQQDEPDQEIDQDAAQEQDNVPQSDDVERELRRKRRRERKDREKTAEHEDSKDISLKDAELRDTEEMPPADSSWLADSEDKRLSRRRERESERERDSERDSERERERERDRERERERERERGRERERERERERGRERDPRRRSRSRSRERYGRHSRDDEFFSRDRGFGYRFSSGRYRSASPGASTVPLDERPPVLMNWDVPPAGYEHMTAMEVKATGLFPLPSHVAVAKMHPSGHSNVSLNAAALRNSSAASVPGMGMTFSSASAAGAIQTSQIARQQRRLYVGNLNSSITDSELVSFFNSKLEEMGYSSAMAHTAIFGGDRSFAFVEFREPEDATTALVLDGSMFGGKAIRVGRPRDYVRPGTENDGLMSAFNYYPPGAGVGGAAFGGDANLASLSHNQNPDKLFIGGIPHSLTEDHIRELLLSFGEIRALNLIKDATTGNSKGYAFCEFVDSTRADVAIEGLHNMEIGDRKLIVQRAAANSRQAQAAALGIGPVASLTSVLAAGNSVGTPSRVLLLLNLGSPDALKNEHELDAILIDMYDECRRFGTVEDIVVPQFGENSDVPPLLSAYVFFANESEAHTAMRAFTGRAYAGRAIISAYYDIERLRNGDYYGAPKPNTDAQENTLDPEGNIDTQEPSSPSRLGQATMLGAA